MEENLLTIPEVAKRLEISRVRIYIWIRQGRMKAVEIKTRYGKKGKERTVYRIPESQCVIPKAKKPGVKPPEVPRLVTPPSKFPPKKKKPKKPNRKLPVELK
jgi:excisionase family DNA binding protein